MIPKIIHYCWFGNNPIPNEYKTYMESWKKYCPDYEIIEWNESNYDVTKNKYMHEAYEAKKWGFVPDYARLDIIYNHGGIYLDTDVEIIKNLDELLKNDAFMGFESKRFVAIGLGFGAQKGHKTIKILRDIYKDIAFLNADGTYNMTPSPFYQTNFLYKNGLKKNNKKQNVCGITIYPAEYFCPQSYETGKLKIEKTTYSIHHYAATWITNEQKQIKELRHKLSKIFPKKLASALAATYVNLKNNGILYTIIKIKDKIFRKSK